MPHAYQGGSVSTGGGIGSFFSNLDFGSIFSTATDLYALGTNAYGTYSRYKAEDNQSRSDQAALNYQASIARVQADQADERALEERSSAGQVAAERYRQIQVQQSRALAVAAAGGSSASSGDVIKTIANLEGFAVSEAIKALAEGDSRAKQYKKQASAFRTDAMNQEFNAKSRKRTGKDRKRATLIRGAGNLLRSDSFRSISGMF